MNDLWVFMPFLHANPHLNQTYQQMRLTGHNQKGEGES